MKHDESVGLVDVGPVGGDLGEQVGGEAGIIGGYGRQFVDGRLEIVGR